MDIILNGGNFMNDLKEVLLTNLKTVITGYEGCGKSIEVAKILRDTIPDNNSIVVFGVTSYALAAEQRKTWIDVLGVSEEYIQVCGDPDSEDNQKYLTDPNNSLMPGKDTRFVFLVQAAVQRLQHVLLGRNIHRLVIDEFNFGTALIPRLAFIICNPLIRDNKEKFDKKIVDYVSKNFSKRDIVKTRQIIANNETDKYHLAEWINSSQFPITVLTSEKLATEFLELVNFTKYEMIGKKDLTQFSIKTIRNSNVNTHFFEKMNQTPQNWEKLGFKYIISDNIAKHLKQNISVKVIPHISVRGSNVFGQEKIDILTIISHIPSQSLQEIQMVFQSYGKDKLLNDIKNLYYRDRIMQAVGRVIGNRAWATNQETHMIIHHKILEIVEENRVDIPYKIIDWKHDFEFLNEVFLYCRNKTENEIENNNNDFLKKMKELSEENCAKLDKLFVKKIGERLEYEAIKQLMENNGIYSLNGLPLQAKKVADYLKCECKNSSKTIEGKTITFKYVKDLALKNN